MTMGDETLFSSMAFPVVVAPIIEQVEQQNVTEAHTLRAAFSKVEAQHPGFIYDLIKGLLKKADLNNLDMSECLLRLEGKNNSKEFHILRQEDQFKILNDKANTLKKILGRIPDEIHDRRRFLETIKDIANAIRNLLDAVNNVFPYIEGQPNKQSIEQRKREFVKYSKRFSNTLKEYFKDNGKHCVFQSANHLINQTNLIMKTVKEACWVTLVTVFTMVTECQDSI